MFVAFALAVSLGAHPVMLADAPTRCNGIVANALTDRARAFEAHPVGQPESEHRFADAERLLAEIRQESEIVREACSDDAALLPVAQQLHAAAAVTYAVESDAALARFGAACPAESPAIAAGFLAGAWLELAQGLLPDGTLPSVLSDIAPDIRTRAAAVKFTLPAWGDTSNYWKTTVEAQGRQAIHDCAK
ncbi:MAG: hypothetical protein KGN02_05100 [bacterium]|nr:hypothetical protein [bacterium]